MLRGAEFVGDETGNSNWLVNFFRFYNTTAVVVDCDVRIFAFFKLNIYPFPNRTTNNFPCFIFV